MKLGKLDRSLEIPVLEFDFSRVGGSFGVWDIIKSELKIHFKKQQLDFIHETPEMHLVEILKYYSSIGPRPYVLVDEYDSFFMEKE